jgi:hypothetical protein
MAFLIGVSLTENYRIANSIIGIRPPSPRSDCREHNLTMG